MAEEMKKCPQCESPYGYESGENQYTCPDCGHEWNAEEESTEDMLIVKDSNGNQLSDGDAVIVLKDLPIKGALRPIKKGTKVNKIRLVQGDHNIDCKIDGFGAVGLKSEFVRKA